MRRIAIATLTLSVAACGSGDYCAAYQSAVNIMDSKVAPCTDGGVEPRFSQSTCESVLQGGNCSSGDRTELANLGSTFVQCASVDPTCSSLTPGNLLGIELQF